MQIIKVGFVLALDQISHSWKKSAMNSKYFSQNRVQCTLSIVSEMFENIVKWENLVVRLLLSLREDDDLREGVGFQVF